VFIRDMLGIRHFLNSSGRAISERKAGNVVYERLLFYVDVMFMSYDDHGKLHFDG
jgi:hypothetical protein